MVERDYEFKLEKQRALRFDYAAIDRIEDHFDTSWRKLMQSVGDLKYRDIAFMLWAGLVHEDPQLTFEMARDLIEENMSMDEVMEALTEGIMRLASKKKQMEMKKTIREEQKRIQEAK
jgi:hypothetical protein